MNFKKILLLFLILVLAIGVASAEDPSQANNGSLEISYDNEVSPLVTSASNTYTVTEGNYDQYFASDGGIKSGALNDGDTVILSGSFTGKNFIISKNITVTGAQDNLITNGKITLTSASSGATISKLNIVNLDVEDKQAIILKGATYCTIEGNNISCSGKSSFTIALNTGSNYNVISNNILKTVGPSANFVLGGAHYNTIKNNYVEIADSNGIYLSQYGSGDFSGGLSNNNLIYNNTVKCSIDCPSSWCYGIQIMGSNNVVDSNTVIGTYLGIGGSTNTNITNNLIVNLTGTYMSGGTVEGASYGISSGAGSNIINNTIKDSYIKESAIYVGDNCVVKDNSVEITGAGAGVTANGNNVIIKDNTIKTVSGATVYQKGKYDGLMVDNNTLVSYSGIGVSADRSSKSKYPTNIVITNNNISTSNAKAINLPYTPSYTLINNDVGSSSVVTQSGTMKPTSISLEAIPDVEFGNDVVIKANITEGSTGTVSFNVSGTIYNVEIVDNKATLTLSNLNIGSHVVTATYGGSGTYLGCSNKTNFKVISQNSIFVSPSGDDDNDGYTWETAVKTIEKAVSLIQDGGKIYIGNGVTVAKNPGISITVTKNVDFVGQDKDLTVIDGQGLANGNYGFFYTDQNNKLGFYNLTFINCKGKLDGGAIGVDYFGNSPNFMTIDNCKFINCSALYSGSAVYVYNDCGTLNLNITNSLFEDNKITSTRLEGAVYLGTLGNNKINLKVDNCTFINNKNKDDVFNSITINYAGAVDAKINHNIFANNTGNDIHKINEVNNGGTVSINADENWWGTNNPTLNDLTLNNWIILNSDSNFTDNLKPGDVISIEAYFVLNNGTPIADPALFEGYNVTINGVKTSIKDGKASYDYTLSNGENLIPISADRANVDLTYSINYEPEEVYVSPSGDDDNDGYTWDTAVKTIEQALTIVKDGGKIYIGNGVTVAKNPGTSITVTKNVDFVGQDKDSTIIDGQGLANGNYGFFYTNQNNKLGFYNLTFINCKGNIGGGAIGVDYFGNKPNFMTIDNCKFINCRSGYQGSAVYVYNDYGILNLNVSNSLFKDNKLTLDYPDSLEGAIYVGTLNEKINLNINNCTFINNTDKKGNFNSITINYAGAVDAKINHNIFANNTGNDIHKINEVNNGGTVSINADENWWGTNNPTVNGITLNNWVILNATAKFNGCTVGDNIPVEAYFVLNNGTPIANPALFEGYNVTINGVSTTINGGKATSNYKVVEGENLINVFADRAVVTLNYNLVIPEILYVSTTGNDENDGLSWDSSLKTINNALKRIKNGGIIYVADGEYIIDSTITASSKDFTIIGQNKGQVILNGNSKKLSKFTSCNIHLINLTFTGGNPKSSSVTQRVGGAIHVTYGSLKVENCTFIDNKAADGGAIYLDGGANLTALNSTFISNDGGSYGGGISTWGGYFTIDSCIFKSCTASSGSAVYSRARGGNITNSIVLGSVYDNNEGVVIANNNWWGSNDNPYPNEGKVPKVETWIVLNSTSDFTDNLGAGDVISVDAYFVLNNGTPIADPALFEGYNVTINGEETTIENGKASRNYTLLKGSNIIPISADNANIELSYFVKESTTIEITNIPALNVGQKGDVTAVVKNETGDVIDTITVPYSADAAGNFTVTLTYPGNETYMSATRNVTVEVCKGTTTLETVGNLPNLTVGQMAAIMINVKDEKGNVIDNITVPYSADAAGNFTVPVNFAGNDNYLPASMNITLNVAKASASISVTVPDIAYGDNVTVTISSSKELNGEVIVNINGTEFTVPIVNGTASFNKNLGLSAGKYNVKANFTGDNSYTSVAANTEFTVDKVATSITAENIVLKVGENGNIVGEVQDEKGNVIDKITVPFNATDAGIFTVPIVYAGNENYNESSININVTVNRGSTTIEITKIPELTIGETGDITADVKDEKGNVIDTITVPYSADAAGNFTVPVNFAGNDNYLPSSTDVTVSVFKSSADLETDDLEMYFKDGSQYKVTVKDSRGNPVAGEKVTLILNGDRFKDLTYQRTTDENGVASLPINLIKGEYSITACYDSKNITSKVSVLVRENKLSADNIVKYYRNGTHYTVKLTNEKGNPIVGEKITVTLKGKSFNDLKYVITTNSDGVATLPINLVAGNYEITAQYDDVKIKTQIEVKDVLITNDLTKSVSKAATLDATFLDDHGKPLVGQKVTYTFKFPTKTVSYTKITDNNGVAKLPINLAKGTYKVTVTTETGVKKEANIKVTA
ncbi:MAG: Ig-like domain repeat protein [Methanobrevibacter sp.]|uniref:Ig-like domain repeat protein n=1 Tax=Methanobrevibacter sp. TaxID=66852 RepID=UPI0026E0A53B|nr:Ig-like domain repeat protein [Methanobrevibacter sp.]MDO5849182.1 Ig-like domain repeat protein [Methanobrevibacter sp.]